MSHNMASPFGSTSSEFKNEIVDDDVEICYEVRCAKFSFSSIHEKCMEDRLEYDEDGDIVVPRSEHRIPEVAIEHCIETHLNAAGLQIWSGCFLLTDYVLFISPSLQGQYVLELGAGTGLCSIVASMFAKHVFATDGSLEVLNNCQWNIMSHEHKLEKQGTFARKVTVKLMDWKQHGHCIKLTQSPYGWTEEEKRLLKKVSLYLASDVIYDDYDATDNFFETVIDLMENSAPSTLYLALEKRVNFVLKTLSVGSPAYDHFRQRCNVISQKSAKYIWDIQQIEVDFPQHFPYERNSQMELWKFECKPLISGFQDDGRTVPLRESN